MVLTLRVTYIKENLGKIVTSRNFKYSQKNSGVMEECVKIEPRK